MIMGSRLLATGITIKLFDADVDAEFQPRKQAILHLTRVLLSVGSLRECW